MKYPKEEILDEEFVYYRVHDHYLDKKTKQITKNAFRPQGDDLSVDWSRYSTAQKLNDRAKKPEKNSVIRFHVEALRNKAGGEYTVEHDPLPTEVVPDIDNQAHSLIAGNWQANKTSIRHKLFKSRFEVVLRSAELTD